MGRSQTILPAEKYSRNGSDPFFFNPIKDEAFIFGKKKACMFFIDIKGLEIYSLIPANQICFFLRKFVIFFDIEGELTFLNLA